MCPPGHVVSAKSGPLAALAGTGTELFVDLGVYTRNRCFRLYLSSKSGKVTKLNLSSGSMFLGSSDCHCPCHCRCHCHNSADTAAPPPVPCWACACALYAQQCGCKCSAATAATPLCFLQKERRRKGTFLDSLVRPTPCPHIITLQCEDAYGAGFRRSTASVTTSVTASARGNTTGASTMASTSTSTSTSSPFPAVDRFFSVHLTSDPNYGSRCHIKSWMLFPGVSWM